MMLKLIAVATLSLGLILSFRIEASSILIRDVSVISSSLDVSRRNVLIRQGKIEAIVPVERTLKLKEGSIIEGRGRYLIPGLIDSHVHLDGVPGMLPRHLAENSALADLALKQIPLSYLYFGFTTVVDLFSNDHVIGKWNSQVLRPDAYHCAGVPIANGYPLAWLPETERHRGPGAKHALYDDRQTAVSQKYIEPKNHNPRTVVKRIGESSAICIKAYFETGFGRLRNLPVPTVKMIRELKNEAERYELPIFLHGNTQISHEFGVAAGIDVFAHGIWHWSRFGQENAVESDAHVKNLLDNIVSKRIGYQPTAQVIYGERELFDEGFFEINEVRRVIPSELIRWYRSDQGQWMRDEIANGIGVEAEKANYELISKLYQVPLTRIDTVIEILAEKNGLFLFGSDTPSGPMYTQFPGINGWFEMKRYINAGVSLAQLFKALTIDNAKALGLEKDIGEIAPGKRANLLLLSKKPLQTIEAYNSIEQVILDGKAYKRTLFSVSK